MTVNPETKPLTIQRNIMDEAIRKEDDWEKIQAKAMQLVDRKWISNEIQKARRQMQLQMVMILLEYLSSKSTLTSGMNFIFTELIL